MQLSQLVETSRRVAETSRRLEKNRLLAALLVDLQADEIEAAVRFLSGNVGQRKLGIGYAALENSAAAPAEAPSLSILDADRALDELARTKGSGSDRRRREVLHSLLARSTAAEQRFLTGLISGELRQGALEGLMLDAIAKAARIDAATIRRAAMMAGDIASVARVALVSGAQGLSQFDVRLFRPVQPMLAQTAQDVDDALDELRQAALEFKFDGARIQVHRSGGDVAVYSRSLNEVTAAVPEVVAAALALPARELILDGEALALTTEGRPQPFQVTMRRFGRKLDVECMRAELPLVPFWFDVLYMDGGSFIDEPQERRFSALGNVAPPGNLVPHRVTADAAEAAAFLQAALSHGHEGIMAKAVTAPYAAGARGQSWLKIKKSHTLDLVILAAEWGHGRRRGYLSNLHLGARDPATGSFVMLGKTFKGLTDEMLAWQTEQLLASEIARDAHVVYVTPKLVAEIAFHEFQASPRYPGGLALRFARVKRYRPDKSPEAADTMATVRKLAASQPPVPR
jgi:DNA ligase-1